VKGIDDEWSETGVPLSVRQFETAWREREAFWLYIVEHALDPVLRRITKIQDPVAHLTEYRFDHGWRAVASSALGSAPSAIEPEVGRTVRLGRDRSGTIIGVQRAGQIILIAVELPDGSQESVVFKPGIMTVEV
jgi:hypothetical protein